MSVFGWDYPAGCSGPPDDDCEHSVPRCSRCGSFLKFKPDRRESTEHKAHCSGAMALDDFLMSCTPCGVDIDHEPHEFVQDYDTWSVRICGKCGHENTGDI